MKTFIMFLFILLSNELYCQWYKQDYPSLLDNFFCVQFVNKDTGWVAGNTIWKTTNGGVSWVDQGPDTVYGISNIFFIDENYGWVAEGAYNNTGRIYRTTDGGDNWANISVSGCGYPGYPTYWTNILFINKDTGWISGMCDGYPAVFHTIDGGVSWDDPFFGIMNDEIIGMFFLNKDTGWFSSSTADVYKTTDGGLTVPVYNANMNTVNLQFFDSINGWACGLGVVETHDGGITWNTKYYNSNLYTMSTYFLNPDTGWVVGGDGSIQNGSIIKKTADGGTTWQTQANGFEPTLMDVFFIDENHGWAVGWNTILRTTTGGNGGLITELPLIIDKAKKSINVLPNPFSNYIDIKYSPELTGNLYFKILDITGAEVSKYNFSVNKNDDFNKRISLSKLPIGLYFYNLSNGNTVNLSGKIIKH